MFSEAWSNTSAFILSTFKSKYENYFLLYGRKRIGFERKWKRANCKSLSPVKWKLSSWKPKIRFWCFLDICQSEQDWTCIRIGKILFSEVHGVNFFRKLPLLRLVIQTNFPVMSWTDFLKTHPSMIAGSRPENCQGLNRAFVLHRNIKFWKSDVCCSGYYSAYF